jgi:hypothetical protein
MPQFALRFRRNASLLAVVACVAPLALIAAGVFALTYSDQTAGVLAWIGAGALVAGEAVFAVRSFQRSSALQQVMLANPDGAVFLGRRQPSVVSDLAGYVSASDVLDQVSDRWVVASIDHRGMAAWSIGRDARELLLIPWAEIGVVEVAPLESGRPGVAVDVRPFATPLLVSVGYSACGIMAAFGHRGVAEVVATTNALRPPD